MLWEQLSAPAFKRAREQAAGVCILPFGVMESHGPHMPIGTDMIVARTIAAEAAKREPAVVFPDYYIGQLAGAQHIPGNICVKHDVLLSTLDEVCREIGRNGFTKIVILNAHGGNPFLIKYFIQSTQQHPRDYVVYSVDIQHEFMPAIRQLLASADDELTETDRQVMADLIASGYDTDHAGFLETALMLGIHPELVDMERIHDEDFRDQKRLSALGREGIYTAVGWYAGFPNNYAGNPTGASERIGRGMLRYLIDCMARKLQVIKQDTHAVTLQKEYYSRWQPNQY
ncbi:creatininase family protein [Paenibacillus sp. HJGM_3]|uniref:creatininase family protein n=1 Tax=Paenibacillus sp. HJGM_3 TaxID=3379816 RepID=UPI00385D9394